METVDRWSAAFNTAFVQFAERAGQYLPSVLGAVALLLIGWVAARILRSLTMRAALLIDRVIVRLAPAVGAERTKLPQSSARMLGTIVFWIVLLFFVTAATQVLGLTGFTAWLTGVVAYLPTLIVGLLIVAAGFLLSRLARQLVVAAPLIAGAKQRELLGRVVQTAILITALLVGADQIGIRVTFLVVMVVAAGGTIAASVALALSLGARSYVANLIGSHYFRQAFSVGQRVRFAGFEGRILEVTSLTVVLETAEGRVTLPARLYGEEPVMLLISGDNRG